MSGPTLVLVHGDYHGSWCWDAVRAHLDDVATVAVDLPSSGPGPGGLGTRQDDVRTLRAAVDAAPGPVVVVAHSAGGIAVCTALAGSPQVQGVVFVAAVVLDRGETAADVLVDSSMGWVDLHLAEGYVRALDPVPTFYHDVAPELARSAAQRLNHKSSVDILTPAEVGVSDWGWPSAYVVCDQDRAISPSDERRMAQRTDQVHDLDSSHSPFLSMPDVFATLVRDVARSFSTAQP